MSEPEKLDNAAPREIPNLWASKPGHNPYLHNIFSLLGIDPDGTQKAYDRASQRWSQKVSSTKEVRFEYEISDLDVARASHLAKEEHEYAAERLLAHTVHEFDASTLKEVMAEANQLTLPKPKDVLPLKIRNLSFLSERLPEPEADFITSESTFPIELLPQLFMPSAAAEDFYEY